MKSIALVAPALSRAAIPVDGTEPWFEPMPPLWALALASHLKARLPGVKVDILDEQLLGPSGLRRKLASSHYGLAGFSPVAYTYEQTLEAARLLKRRGALVIFGGHYAPQLAPEILALRGPGSKDHCVDGLVRYEGEAAIEALARGESFEKVPNLVWSAGGGVKENPCAEADLAAPVPADYSLAPPKKYFALQSGRYAPVLPFVSQRGCRWAQGPGRCFFCSISTRGGLRALPPEETVERLRELGARHGAGCVFEGSDDFPADPAWLERFAAAASRRRLPELRVFARATTLTPASVKLLKFSGVKAVSIGVESMSAEVLRRARKGSSPAANSRAMRLLLEAGILPKVHLILGLPGETRATLSETLANFKKMPLPAASPERVLLASTFAVYPGTRAWRDLLRLEPAFAGTDRFDEEALFAAWLRHFTGLTAGDVEAARTALERLFAARVRTVS
jgi:radical SAM superfamily enzyme YgiQ (UPF0313 family)